MFIHGFCKRQTCKTHLIKTGNDLVKSLNVGQQLDSILWDFSKAFDIFCHQIFY